MLPPRAVRTIAGGGTMADARRFGLAHLQVLTADGTEIDLNQATWLDHALG